MKFVLVEAEIKQAIQEYAAKLITLAPGTTIEVEVKATRGTDGVTAEIDVALTGALQVAAPAAPVQTPRTAEVKPAAEKPAPAPAPTPAPTPAPAASAAPQEPKAEVIGQSAPVDEPTIPDEEEALNEDPTPAAGKSIFG
ncbi:gp077 [Erwinia phage vB_EamP-S6]|uniref:Gp077 n=1 Tax=Erwinia phage vB_EamP-S6 TaxID=1051675 RepID=G0YQG9_9CAUD|nr:gp077 [Erwinia phage vB_EamP-S6]AEJ81596.1 gp077 [Erwinia phage vB_EamP-S6]